MVGLPKFSDGDLKRLARLGVTDSQIEQLRYARLAVRLAITPPPARNDVAILLVEVAGLAHSLQKKMASIDAKISAAHASAHLYIEQGYWQARPDDYGASSFHCTGPRLEALKDAALKGKDALPTVPSRRHSASPAPIKRIAEALRLGWTKEHGTGVYNVRYVDGKEVKTYDHPCGSHPKPLPKDMRPGAADGSAFREIVGICYGSEGGNPDPLAAIKSYLKIEREARSEAIAALQSGIAEAAKPRNRTSRKK